jgi:hypothetical protein
MSQDAQDTPAPPVTTPSRLQVVLLAYGKDGKREAAKDQHTLIRFPQTYEVIARIPLPLHRLRPTILTRD